MKNLFYHHLGLGDHIVHNGMIRYIYSKLDLDDELYIFCKKHNFKNVEFMFRDIKRLKIITVIDDVEAIEIFTKFDGKKINNVLNNKEHIDYHKLCDDIFYLKMGLNPNLKRGFFHIERDSYRENELFEKVVTEKEYIFLHEDDERGFVIDRNKIDKNLPIVKSNIKYNFFDYLKVIENAKEVHLISSSFLSLITCIKLNVNVFAHLYLRNKSLSDYLKRNDINVYE
jgi:hypothetical protein